MSQFAVCGSYEIKFVMKPYNKLPNEQQHFKNKKYDVGQDTGNG